MGSHEFMICMGFDAMRIALGQRPKNFTKIEVLRWMKQRAKELEAE